MKEKYSILAAVLVGGMMAPLDSSVVNVAMPTLAEVFNTSVSTVSWVSMTYLLVLSSLMLTYGRLGDMLGYKKLFTWGMLIFTLSSMLCGLSPNIAVLIFARAIQALGGGLMMAAAPAILINAFPSGERGRALGYNAMAIAFGLALGPPLGGFLLHNLGWSYIFYINLPIGVIGYFLAKKVIPPDKEIKPEKFDIPGAILGFIFLSAILFYISKGQEIGWASSTGYLLLFVFAVSFTVFLVHEKCTKSPMLDLKMFKNRMFFAGNLSCFLNYTAQNIMIFLTPFYLVRAGFTTNQIGVIMMAFPLTVLLLAPISGTISDRTGPLILSTSGALMSAVGLYLMGALSLSSSAVDVMWRMVIFGVGYGLFQAPNNSSVMGSVSANRLGVASGILATMKYTGMVFGVAIGSGIFELRHSYYLRMLSATGSVLENQAFMLAVRDAYLAAAFIDVLCMLTSSVRGKAACA